MTIPTNLLPLSDADLGRLRGPATQRVNRCTPRLEKARTDAEAKRAALKAAFDEAMAKVNASLVTVETENAEALKELRAIVEEQRRREDAALGLVSPEQARKDDVSTRVFRYLSVRKPTPLPKLLSDVGISPQEFYEIRSELGIETLPGGSVCIPDTSK
jgi:hypothetical protein